IDPDGLDPVVAEAEKKGIPVISVDSVIDHKAVDVQVGVDNSEASKRMGEYFNENAAELFGDKEIQLGVVSALNAPVQVNRQDSFLETIKGNNVNVTDIVDGENVQEKA